MKLHRKLDLKTKKAHLKIYEKLESDILHQRMTYFEKQYSSCLNIQK